MDKYPGVLYFYLLIYLFIYLRSLQAVVHSGWINLHSQQWCKRVPFSPQPCQHLFIIFLIITILTGVRWYCIVILICISLMISDVEHLFMFPLVICMSSWNNVYSGHLPIIHTSPKIFMRSVSMNVLPMFASRSFMVSDLIFNSIIHFGFIFVYGVRKWSSWFLCMQPFCFPNTID